MDQGSHVSVVQAAIGLSMSTNIKPNEVERSLRGLGTRCVSGIEKLEKLASKWTRKPMPTDEETVRSEGRLYVCVSLWKATRESKDPGWMDYVSKLLGSVWPVTGRIHSVYVYMLLCAWKSVPVAGVGLWSLETTMPRCQQWGRSGIHGQLLNGSCI